MNLPVRLLLASVAFASNFFATTADTFPVSRNPFEGIIPIESIPQFITLTFSGGLSASRVDAIRKYVMNVTDSNGCSPKFTAFVSFDYTDCSLVNGIYKGGNELASHTLDHKVFPSLEQIQGGIDFFSQCGIPQNHVKGFRTPYLSYDQSTLDHLHTLGIMYDSSIVADDGELNNYGRNNIWPFTWDTPEDTNITCNCNKSKPLPGLWEIPMYRSYPGEKISDPDISAVKDNFDRRYNGNRAPLGVYIESSLESDEAAGQALAEWIADIQSNYADAFFVTNQELINWMRNPTPGYQPNSCASHVSDCFPPGPTYTCPYGSAWSTDACACECTPGFCMDEEGGKCTPDACDATSGSAPCCSENFRNCINYCGSTLDDCRECTASSENVYGWLLEGDMGTNCTARYGGCSSDENSCCPGLTCVRVDAFTASCEYVESPEPSFSRQPSTMPTSSSPPSTLPSDLPSNTPSITPSQIPSTSPTSSFMPSPAPSSVPSSGPTLSEAPSLLPSAVPSYTPSVLASGQPSNGPSVQASDSPSRIPSDVPSLLPSLAPSALPTGTPTAVPSNFPTKSESPSLMPSDVPSGIPSVSPTTKPSEAPTSSNRPSMIPSMFPSSAPSAGPTNAVSDTPTASLKPSISPSDIPSSVPSLPPSANPSVSVEPTKNSAAPSLKPTDFASQEPTISMQPSISPSDIPSVIPSSDPSAIPSSFPTDVLSSSPTATSIPSESPTIAPSDFPSSVPSSSLSPSEVQSSAPTRPIVPCCSQDHKTCISWCGDNRDGCDQCNQWGGYFWLPLGEVDETCIEKEGTGCAFGESDDRCCLGLMCSDQGTFFKCISDPNYVEDDQSPSVAPSIVPSSVPSAPTAAPSVLPSQLPSSFVCRDDFDCADMNSGILVGVCADDGVCIPEPKPCTDNSFCTGGNVEPYVGVCEKNVCALKFNCHFGAYNSTYNTCVCTGGPAPSSEPGYCHNELGQCTVPRVATVDLLFQCPTGSYSGHPGELSSEPSAIASSSPSVTPVNVPSSTPSDTPSQIPSAVPSAEPSSAPTAIQSEKPTSVESFYPTISGAPTSSPSHSPSSTPTVFICDNDSQCSNLDAALLVGVCMDGDCIQAPRPCIDNTACTAANIPPYKGICENEVCIQVFNCYSGEFSEEYQTCLCTGGPEPSTEPGYCQDANGQCLALREFSAGKFVCPNGSLGTGYHMIPTQAPSLEPTWFPSWIPSSLPIAQPTNYPTDMKSETPSEVPSSPPSNNPSLTASASPNASPTIVFSTNPTVAASSNPTVQHSGSPSVDASLPPSGRPTVEHSSSPTVQHSGSPSIEASASPSASPVVVASSNPTVEHSGSPSVDASLPPSGSPTVEHSSSPTVQHSGSPSLEASASPSASPTIALSSNPTVAASSSPTVQHSGIPSLEASASPSASPVVVASSNPTVQHSGIPSVDASLPPSASPVVVASLNPTSEYSANPTVEHSGSPSVDASAPPTDLPSIAHSESPSGSPVVAPSFLPSYLPSDKPSIFVCSSDSQCSVLDEGVFVGVCVEGDCVRAPKACVDDIDCVSGNIDPYKGVCRDNICEQVNNCNFGEYSAELTTCLCTGGPTPSIGPGYCQDEDGKCLLMRVYNGRDFICPESSLGSGYPFIATAAPTKPPSAAPVTGYPTSQPTEAFSCQFGTYNEEYNICVCTGGRVPSAGPGYCQDERGQCSIMREPSTAGFVCPPVSPGDGYQLLPPTSEPTMAPTVTVTVQPVIPGTIVADEFPDEGCCSMDFKTCGATWCGGGFDKDACTLCNAWGGYQWLSGGARNSCSGSWESCSTDADCCDESLSCSWGQCAP